MPGGRLLDTLAALPLVFPAIVLGLAFLEMFVHGGTHIYGTVLSLVIASVVAYMPYGLRYAQLGVIQIHPELEEAAAIAGARQAGAFVRIVLPLSGAGADLVLAVRLPAGGPRGVVGAAAGRAGFPGRRRALFDLWNNGQIGELAALGCVWTAIMTVFSVAFFLVARRYQLSIG